MSHHSQNISADDLLQDLDRARLGLKKRQRYSILLLFAGVIISSLLLLQIPEYLLFLPAWFKSLWWVVTVVAAFYLGYKSWNRSDSNSLKEFYRSFCSKTGLPEVMHALDLYLGQSGTDSRFYQFAIEKNLQNLDRSEWNNRLTGYVNSQKSQRELKIRAIFSFAAVSLLTLSVMTGSDALKRSAQFWETYDQPNPFEFTVLPGDTTLEHGTPFLPEITFHGTTPDELTLAFKTEIEDQYRYRPMAGDENGHYRSVPVDLTNSGSYYFIMDRFESPSFTINVQFRPRFESLTVTTRPPPYTGLTPEEMTYPFAQLSLYEGTEFRINGFPNKPVDQLNIQFLDSLIAMRPAGEGSRSASFIASRSDTLQFQIRDEEGLENGNPFRFFVRVLQDQPPSVTLRQPQSAIELTNPDSLLIAYTADDDFGLTSARLDWELTRAFTDAPIEGSSDLQTPSRGELNLFQWDLAGMDLRPRDVLTWRLSVVDNDGWNGYKRAWSPEMTIRIPSMTTWLDGLDEREDETENRLEEMSSAFSEMQQQYEQFREEMSRTETPDWEEEQLLEEVRSRQQEIENAAQELMEQFESVREEIENSNSLSEETKSAYQQLQQVMQELDSPELQQALEELREAMQNLNPQALENAMQNYEFNEQAYQERLERTLDLFRTLQMNSNLERLAVQYEDMAERMEQVARDESPENQQRDQQMSVREDTESAGERLDQLGRQAPERAQDRLRQLQEESLSELESIQQELDRLISEESSPNSDSENEPAASPSENSESSPPAGDQNSDNQQIQNNNRERQQAISEQLQDRAQSFRNARQQMNGQQQQLNLLALQRALYTLINLSESQEELTIDAGRTESRSQSYVDLTREQNRINMLFRQVSDSLRQIAAETPVLSSEINRRKLEVGQILDRSQQQMANRNQPSAVTASRESLAGINELTSMLASLLDQLAQQQSGAGSGMMSMQQMLEQIQGMSQDQQQLNREIEQMINDMQGERLSRDQSERLEQIARQQNEIRQQLENLQRSGALGPGDRIMSEMQRTLEEMEDAINDMRGGIANPGLVERQQNILSRMLNAEDALQQRGEEEDEYEGETADPFLRAVPSEMTLEELQQEIRSRLNSPDYTRFSDEYQRLIERYFEELRQFEDAPVP